MGEWCCGPTNALIHHMTAMRTKRVLTYLRAYRILDTSRKRGVGRPMRWDDIPFDESASPEVKALEFDLQIIENGGTLDMGSDSEKVD